MIRRRPGTHRVRPRRSRAMALIVLCLFAGVFVSAAGCGTETPEGGPPPTGGGAAPSTTEAPEQIAGPLASGVIATWAEAMQKLVGLVQERPEAAAVRPAVESLKEEYVQKLVTYGRQREDLSEAEQQQIDSLLAAGLPALQHEPWFQSYMSLYEHYSKGDLDFANLLASFNILTQYADFDLLKAQAPDEAIRLGVD